jgi:hypothetical protein
MTHAHHFPPQMPHVQPASAVLDDGRFVVAASCGRSPIPAIAADFSIATTAAPSAGIPRCSNAPSHVLDENSFRIPSTNTSGFAVDALDLLVFSCCLRVDFSDDLIDLDWGSWEGSLPESSSLGGDGSPLRGAFIDSASSTRGLKYSLRDTLSFGGPGDILHRHRFAAAWHPLVPQIGPLFHRRRHPSSKCDLLPSHGIQSQSSPF